MLFLNNNMVSLTVALTFRGLIQCEASVSFSYDWRLQAAIFKGWASGLPKWFSSQQIFFHVIPFLFEKIEESRPLPGGIPIMISGNLAKAKFYIRFGKICL
jgi:hypothetical protein